MIANGLFDLGAKGLADDAAMLSSTVAAIAALVMLWRQRDHRRETKANADRLVRVEDTLNHTDQEITTPDGPATLGQRVVQVQRSQTALEETMTDGFRRNDETHYLLGEAVHQAGQRIDAQRDDLDRAHARISAVEKRITPGATAASDADTKEKA